MKNLSEHSFLLPPDESDNRFAGIGHIPLLWILAPLLPALALCFAFDFHAPRLGLALLFAFGVPAIFLKNRKFLWAICHIIAVAGFAIALFAVRVPMLPHRPQLPPREAELTLRWERRFAEKPDAKTISGIARVLRAPRQIPELAGNDVYCQIRKPVPEPFAERGATFRAIGVVDNCGNHFESLAEARDFVRYLEYRRANSVFARGRFLEPVAGPPAIYRQGTALRKRFENSLRLGLEKNPDAAELLSAMMLGNKNALSRETLATFQRTGTMHLFAVSGLHIGVIAAGLFWFFKCIRITDTIARLSVVGVLFAFVIAAGAPASAMRAWFMITCMLGAGLISRKSNPATGLALAATLVVIFDPRTLLDIGFQLSYSVVAAILLYGLPLAKYVNARWDPWRDLPAGGLGFFAQIGIKLKARIVDSLGIGLAATIASTPIVVAHFKIFSVGGIFINVFVVPASFPVMLAGFTSLLLGSAGLSYLAIPLNIAAGILIKLIAETVRLASEIPGMAYAAGFRSTGIGIISTFTLLGIFLIMNAGSRPPRPALFFIPPAIVAIALLFG